MQSGTPVLSNNDDANGSISVERAHSSVTAKSACGDLRIGGVTAGTIVADTAYGEISVGIRQGAAAWLDVGTDYGSVRNTLDPSEAPEQSEATVDVRARTSYGDVVISRSSA